jgi:hypothetical protein
MNPPKEPPVRGLLLKAGLLMLLWPVGLSAPEVLCVLCGRITDGSGAPVAKAIVALISAQGKVKVRQSNARGEYVIRDIAPGLYTIWTAEGDLSRFEKTRLEAIHGQVQSVDITLVPSAHIRPQGLPALPNPQMELTHLESPRKFLT